MARPELGENIEYFEKEGTFLDITKVLSFDHKFDKNEDIFA